MRICSPHCGIAPETTSGGETYERELLVRLGRAGVPIDLILARGKPHPPAVPNWTVHRFRIGRGLRWYVAPFVVPRAIKRVHDATGFDLLRVHSLRYIGPAALWARWRYDLRVPVVAHHHHLDRSLLNPIIEKRVIEQSDYVITVSEFSKRQLASELGVRVDHVVAIHNGVDERFAPGPRDAVLAARLGVHDRPVAMFLGGLKPRKNLHFLLDVWAQVAAKLPEPMLLIAGAGDLADPLRRTTERLGLASRVVFSGHVPEGEKVEFYNLADVFVSPSHLEGFGLSVAEAMSCGRPVVVPRVGALPELVGPGLGAILCEPDSVDDFAAALISLLSSREAARERGRANHERVDRLFRWDRTVRQVLDVYELARRKERSA